MMPNLLVHLTFSLIIAKILNLERKSILLFGSFLPDIKAFFYPVIILISGLADANAFILPIGSPIGSLLLGLFFSSLFPKEEFKKVFGLLSIGVISHIALDMMMFPLYGIEHYLPFYPFSWEPIGMNTNWLLEWMSILCLIWVILMALSRTSRKFYANSFKITD